MYTIGKTGLRRALVLMAALAMLLVVPTGAAAAIEQNVDGLATFVDECDGQTSIATLALEGSFDGCLYTDTIKQARFTDDGVYTERGTETIAGCWDSPGGEKCGTLSTTYEFIATFDADGNQLSGGCTHPIVGGTGDFAGASGLLVFVDDVEAGTADFRGFIDLP